MTDQQRADHSAPEGFPLDMMPFLDELAQKRMWFDRAYASTPVCPGQNNFLTGRFPTAIDAWINQQQDRAEYEQDLADVMNDVGYRTAFVGKNHSTPHPRRGTSGSNTDTETPRSEAGAVLQ